MHDVRSVMAPTVAARSRYLAVVLTAAIGTLASIAVALLILSWERRVAEIDFQNKAQSYLQVVNGDLGDAATLLYTMGAYVQTNQHEVSRAQFGRFAQVLHDRVTALRSIGWAPRVTRAERPAFERRALTGVGIPQRDRIIEFGKRGTFVTAADRPSYYPIFYIEAGRQNHSTELRRILGFDLMSERLRAAAIARALRTGRPAATPPLRMITVKGPVGGVMGFMVVRKARAGVRSAQSPTGVVLGAFDIGAMIENIIGQRMRVSGLDLYVFDPAGSPGHRLIYWHTSSASGGSAPAEREILASTHWQGTVSMIDQRWGAIVAPSSELRWQSGISSAFVTFVAGITMTAMIVAYLLISVRRAAQLEAISENLRATTAELERKVEQIADMARHDALTGLPNRVLFRERMDEALARHRRGMPFATCFLDLDNFKAVNDTLGHSAGDSLLCMAAARIADCLREIDTFARLGGDEFGILFADTAAHADIARVADRLVTEVGKPFTIDGEIVLVGVSIGISVASVGDGPTAEGLLKEADLALYEAKGAGRGTYRFFQPHIRAQIEEQPADKKRAFGERSSAAGFPIRWAAATSGDPRSTGGRAVGKCLYCKRAKIEFAAEFCGRLAPLADGETNDGAIFPDGAATCVAGLTAPSTSAARRRWTVRIDTPTRRAMSAAERPTFRCPRTRRRRSAAASARCSRERLAAARCALRAAVRARDAACRRAGASGSAPR
jgi:diguanylate cyclase (GGDEF)-like protein